jgi:hypothetical protein
MFSSEEGFGDEDERMVVRLRYGYNSLIECPH